MEKRIVICGMTRAGSTVLYNIVRLAYISLKKDFYSNFITDYIKYIKENPSETHIIKTHAFHKSLMGADIYLTAKRDIRDVLASNKRRRKLLIEDGIRESFFDFKKCAISNVSYYDKWKDYSDHEFVYEEYCKNPIDEIKKVLLVLDIGCCCEKFIYNELQQMKDGTRKYRNVNGPDCFLLHHITDGRVSSYKETLTKEEIDYLENEPSFSHLINGGTTMDIKKLRQDIKDVNYPANQGYDPETLKAFGVAKDRIKLLKKNAPEMFKGGESLIDIGSNKGFIAMSLRNLYSKVYGYELSHETHSISQRVKEYHNAENVEFINDSFRNISLNKFRFQKYTVTYCGSVHHHFFKDCILHGVSPWLFMKKLIAITDKYLILDGPFSVEGDFSLSTWAKEHGWSDDIINQYTLERHCKELLPQFEFVRIGENERKRQTAVFRRVAPDIEHAEFAGFPKDGKILKIANRKGDAIAFCGKERYKLDRGMQSDGVFLILNYLSDYFAKTKRVLCEKGKRIGDVAELVEGESIADAKTMWKVWLEINNALSAVGLIEPHFKMADYKLLGKRYVDVDVDMIQMSVSLAKNTGYLKRWAAATTKAVGPKHAASVKKLQHSMNNEFLFKKLLGKL